MRADPARAPASAPRRRVRYDTVAEVTARCCRCKSVFVPTARNYERPLPQCPDHVSCVCDCGGAAIQTWRFRRVPVTP